MHFKMIGAGAAAAVVAFVAAECCRCSKINGVSMQMNHPKGFQV